MTYLLICMLVYTRRLVVEYPQHNKLSTQLPVRKIHEILSDIQ